MSSHKVRHLRPTESRTGDSKSQTQAVSRAELDLLLQKTLKITSKKADKAANILTDWLKQPANKSHLKKHTS